MTAKITAVLDFDAEGFKAWLREEDAKRPGKRAEIVAEAKWTLSRWITLRGKPI